MPVLKWLVDCIKIYCDDLCKLMLVWSWVQDLLDFVKNNELSSRKLTKRQVPQIGEFSEIKVNLLCQNFSLLFFSFVFLQKSCFANFKFGGTLFSKTFAQF